MNIIVLIKQVVNTTDVRLDPDTATLVREGVENILNPFDEHAVEEALRLREAHGGTVTVLSMGPARAADVIRRAVAMGADAGILVSDRALRGSDTWATAYTLSMAVRKIGSFDLILTGRQAVDGDTAQVGPEVAACLDLPMIAWVRKIEIIAHGVIRAERLMEDGHDVLESSLPAVLSVVKEINQPRMATMKSKMRAMRYSPTVWAVSDIEGLDAEQIGLAGSPTRVQRTFAPERQYHAEIIPGEPADAAARLYSKLQQLRVIS